MSLGLWGVLWWVVGRLCSTCVLFRSVGLVVVCLGVGRVWRMCRYVVLRRTSLNISWI